MRSTSVPGFSVPLGLALGGSRPLVLPGMGARGPGGPSVVGPSVVPGPRARCPATFEGERCRGDSATLRPTVTRSVEQLGSTPGSAGAESARPGSAAEGSSAARPVRARATQGLGRKRSARQPSARRRRLAAAALPSRTVRRAWAAASRRRWPRARATDRRNSGEGAVRPRGRPRALWPLRPKHPPQFWTTPQDELSTVVRPS